MPLRWSGRAGLLTRDVIYRPQRRDFFVFGRSGRQVDRTVDASATGTVSLEAAW
jgi:hypothetical protein